MKALLFIIPLFLASAGHVGAQGGAKKTETRHEVTRTPVEKQLVRAIGLSWESNFAKALETVRSLYGRKGADQALILRAETAICAAQAANRLDTWEGSDFGKATPWWCGIEGSLWQKWETGKDGKVTIEPRDDVSIEYFDMIIEHSLKRLQRVSEKGTR